MERVFHCLNAVTGQSTIAPMAQTSSTVVRYVYCHYFTLVLSVVCLLKHALRRTWEWTLVYHLRRFKAWAIMQYVHSSGISLVRIVIGSAKTIKYVTHSLTSVTEVCQEKTKRLLKLQSQSALRSSSTQSPDFYGGLQLGLRDLGIGVCSLLCLCLRETDSGPKLKFWGTPVSIYTPHSWSSAVNWFCVNSDSDRTCAKRLHCRWVQMWWRNVYWTETSLWPRVSLSWWHRWDSLPYVLTYIGTLAFAS